MSQSNKTEKVQEKHIQKLRFQDTARSRDRAAIDMHDDKAVRDTLVLFRPLDGNVRAEVEHHNTRYTKDLCQRYQDNLTASGPDEIARAVREVMGEEDSKWREAVHAQTQVSRTNVRSGLQKWNYAKTRCKPTSQHQ